MSYLYKLLTILYILVYLTSCGGLANNSTNDDGWIFPSQENEQSTVILDKDIEDLESGKCYARCLIDGELEFLIHKYYRYTGTNVISHPNVRETRIITSIAHTRMEKREIPNCSFSNLELCLKSHIIDDSIQSIKVLEVIDTNILKTFVEDSILIERLHSARGSYDLVEVMCDADVDSIIISNIQMVPIDEGYNILHGITGVIVQVLKEL